MKKYIITAMVAMSIGHAFADHQFTYKKNTCNDNVFRGLTLNQAYQKLHFEETNKFGTMLSYSYCQQEYSLDDPINDYLMIERAILTGKVFGSSMFNKKSDTINEFQQSLEKLYFEYGTDINNYFRNKEAIEKAFVTDCNQNNESTDFCYDHNDKDVIISNNYGKDKWKRPLRIRSVVNGITAIISKYKILGIKPKKGKVHSWSKEFKEWTEGTIVNPNTGQEHKIKTSTRFSKLLTGLSTGTTSIFLKTGSEANIKEWLLEQADKSVDLYQMFEKSYQLNNGDIYLTLLSIENVLSADWLVLDRNSLPWIKKLKSITYQKEGIGDNYGAWYHFWGMTLFSYVKGKAIADTFAMVEAFISLFDPNNPVSNDIQEMHINFAGAKLGSKLRRVLKKSLWEGHIPSGLEWDHSSYMR